MKTVLILIFFGLSLGISLAQGMQVADGERAYQGGRGHLMIGLAGQERLSIDYNLLQTYEARDPSVLHLNSGGGTVKIGDDQSTTILRGNLIVENHQATGGIAIYEGLDVNLTSSGFMQLGLQAGKNLALDNNEIQARDGGKVSSLFLNHEGGALYCRGLRNIGDKANMQFNITTGEIGYETSSRRYKTNILNFEDDWSKILKSRAVKYDRPNSPGQWEFGYIAEEMDSIGLHSLVFYDRLSQPENFNYEKMILYTTELLKIHNRQIIALQERDQQISKLEEKLKKQEHGLVALHKRIIALETKHSRPTREADLLTNY